MNLTRKKNQIQFKTFETPTAWVVLAIAWRVIDGKVVYSEPKIVRVVQKPETALAAANAKNKKILLEGKKAAAKSYKKFVPSPYVFEYTPERLSSLGWHAARAPTK